MRRWIATVTWVWQAGEVEVARGRIGSAEGGESGLAEASRQPLNAGESPEERQQRLVSLRKAIAAGEYHVPAEAVAQRVMDRMLADGRSRAMPGEDDGKGRRSAGDAGKRGAWRQADADAGGS